MRNGLAEKDCPMNAEVWTRHPNKERRQTGHLMEGSHLHSVRRLIVEGQQGAYQWRCANQEVIMFSLSYRVAAPCPNPILEFKETLDHVIATCVFFRIDSAFDRNVPIRYPTLRVSPDCCFERHTPTQEVFQITPDSVKTHVLDFIEPRSGNIESMGDFKVIGINGLGSRLVELLELHENGMIHGERGTAESSRAFVVDGEIMGRLLSGY